MSCRNKDKPAGESPTPHECTDARESKRQTEEGGDKEKRQREMQHTVRHEKATRAEMRATGEIQRAERQDRENVLEGPRVRRNSFTKVSCWTESRSLASRAYVGSPVFCREETSAEFEKGRRPGPTERPSPDVFSHRRRPRGEAPAGGLLLPSPGVQTPGSSARSPLWLSSDFSSAARSVATGPARASTQATWLRAGSAFASDVCRSLAAATSSTSAPLSRVSPRSVSPRRSRFS